MRKNVRMQNLFASMRSTNFVLYSKLAKIRPQAKIDNFTFKNSNIIIEGII